MQDFLQRVEDFRAVAHRLRKDGAPNGRIMNSWMSTLLSACAPPLMMFIIGTGMTGGPPAGEVAIQRQPCVARGGVRGGQRYRQNRVRAELGFVVGAVHLDHLLIESR